MYQQPRSKSNIKALFITTGVYALGETYIALSFANALREAGISCFFVAPPFGAKYVREFSFPVWCIGSNRERNTVEFHEYLEEIQPNLILFADCYDFEINDTLKRVFPLKWVEHIGIPMVSFDYFGFAPHGRSVYFEHLGHCMEIDIDRGVRFFIKPCPFNRPSREENDGIFSWGVDHPAPYISDMIRQRIRASLGCHKEDKVILYPISKWAYAVSRNNGIRLYEYMQDILEWYLKKLNRRIHVVNVCSMPVFEERSNGNVQFHCLSSLPISEFEGYLLSCDLLLTDNSTGSVIIRAISDRIPVMVLKNSLDLDESECVEIVLEADKEFSELVLSLCRRGRRKQIFPFYNFPWGWVDELESLFRDNPVRNCVVWAELFGGWDTLRSMEDALFNMEFKKNILRQNDDYIESLSTLPSSLHIVNEILARSS